MTATTTRVAALAFLQAVYLRDGEPIPGFIEFRLLSDNRTPGQKPVIHYLDTTALLKSPAALDPLADDVRRLSREGYGVFYGAATRQADKHSKASGKTDTHMIPGLWADLDSTNDPELLYRFMPPSVLIRSGGGFQAWWLFDEPVKSTPTIDKVLQGLAAALGSDTSVAERAHILRLPGTTNRKAKYGPDSPVCELVEENRTRYSLEDFTRFYPAQSAGQNGHRQPDRPRDQVPPWLADVLAESAPVGERNRAVYRRTLYLRENTQPELSEAEALRYFDHLAAADFTLKEIETTVKSAFRAEIDYRSAPQRPVAKTNGKATAKAPENAPQEPQKTQDPPQDDDYMLTDTGNALRFVDDHGADWRYCHAWDQWLFWDGVRWKADGTGQVILRAMETAQKMFDGLGEIGDNDKRAAVAKWAIRSQQGPRLREMVTLARAFLPITPGELDRDKWLLNCQNGTVNLQTGELQPHDRADFITRIAPVRFDPDVIAPTWDAHLKLVFDGDKSLIDFFARAVGYTLTGDTSEQVLFLLYGTGENGKSKTLEAIRDMLGDYAQNADFSSFLARDRTGASEDIARLKGARFVTAIEAEAGKRLSEVLVKQLTGSDTITARFLYSGSFEFRPEFKLFFGVNHKPEVWGNDHAIWRRIRLIPFNVKIPPEKRDKDIAKRLRLELAGILSWAVRGCREWQENGLQEPQPVTSATADYRDEMDVLAGFIDEKCQESTNASVSIGNLYLAYVAWAQENGERPLSKRAFGLRMTERGYQRGKSSSTRTYKGIGLLADGVQDEIAIA